MRYTTRRSGSPLPVLLALITVLAAGGADYAGADEPGDAAVRSESAATQAAATDEAHVPATGGQRAFRAGIASGEGAKELHDYIAVALKRSPRLSLARSRYAAAAERASRAGGLPDPVVSYGHYFREVETRVGPQRERYGLRQHLPLFGKLSLRRKAAEARADAERERLRAVELAVVVDVTRAYADCAYLAKAAGITSERLSLLSSLERVVRSLYASGEASYSDLMSAQVSVARVENELETLEDEQIAASARLAAAVGSRPDRTLMALPVIPDAVVPELTGASSTELTFNPELGALDFEAEASRLERGLAVRGYLPDLTLGFDYIVTDEAAMDVGDSGKDPFVGVASINLPLWLGQNASRVREADERLNAAERARENKANVLLAELESALAGARGLQRRERLYDERLIPAALQSVAASEASYRAGETDFDALIRAHETALEFQLSRARVRADLLTSAADIGRLTGADYSLTE